MLLNTHTHTHKQRMKEKEREAFGWITHNRNERLGTRDTAGGRGRPDRDVKAIMTPVWLIDSAAKEHKPAVCFNSSTCGSLIFINRYELHQETFYVVVKRTVGPAEPQVLHFWKANQWGKMWGDICRRTTGMDALGPVEVRAWECL